MPFGANDQVLFGGADELVDAPLEGELLPPSGPRGRRYTPTSGQRMYQRTMDSARGQADAGVAALDLVGNTVVNAPADILNSAANLAATAVGRTGNLIGLPNNIEADARDPSRGFARVPLLTEQGRGAAEAVGNVMPDWLRNLDPAYMDLLNVAGAKGGVEALRPSPRLIKPENIRNAGAVAPIAKAAGFDVTPSTVAATRSVQPSGTASFLEAHPRNAEASLRNAQTYNRRLGDELNIRVDADGRLEPGAFDEARQPAFSVYEEAKTFAGGPSQDYANAVAAAIAKADVPTEGAAELARLSEKYANVGDTAQLVEDLKNLRRTAGKRRQGDAANQVANEALADVQTDIANALEDELGRRAAAAGDAGFQQRLRDARVHLAQLHEAERATHGGYVDLEALAARQAKTGNMTGNLKLGAMLGENMPEAFQHPQRAAPAAQGRLPEAASQGGLIFRTMERLGGGKLSRGAMRRFNEKIPFGPNALDEFGINPVRDRGYPSPMGPNAGPPAPPAPPPNYGPRPLELAPEPNRDFSSQLGAGVVPWERPTPVGEALPVLDASQRQNLSGLTLTDMRTGAQEPSRSFASMLDEPLPLEGGAPAGRGVQGDFSSQLGPVRDPLLVPEPPGMPDRPRGVSGPESAQLGGRKAPPGLSLEEPDFSAMLAPRATMTDAELLAELSLPEGDFASMSRELGPSPGTLEVPPGAGMPDRPRGLSGPRSAQLSDPRLPEGLQLIDDTPPPQPFFGPGDEFPGGAAPAAPVAPQGPAPAGAGGANFSDTLGLQNAAFDVPPDATSAQIRQMLEPVNAELDRLRAERAVMRERGAGNGDPALVANGQESKPLRDQFFKLMKAMNDAEMRELAAKGPPRSFDMLATDLVNGVREGLTGQRPPQNLSDLVGDLSMLEGGAPPEMMYRGVPEGADPFAPNERNFTTWSNTREGEYGASRYGSNIAEEPFDPSANVHLGSLEDARRVLGLPPEATAQDIAEAAMRRYRDANRTASYDLPAGLEGTPREYIRFGPQGS